MNKPELDNHVFPYPAVKHSTIRGCDEGNIAVKIIALIRTFMVNCLLIVLEHGVIVFLKIVPGTLVLVDDVLVLFGTVSG